jgi:glycosyltransferase involved in cell wall biosynthesis
MIHPGKRPTFSVITPCRNAAARLPTALRLVQEQTAVISGRADVQHVVIDGASTDDTREVVTGWRGHSVELISEPDQGMYDALAKGLRRATGDWITYLNAGDTLDETAFDTVLDIASKRGNISWITGRSVMKTDRGQLVRGTVPFAYRRSLILAGQYCRRPPLFLPFLQQEGTFWRRDLNDRVDLERLSRFRLAGDYYLWHCFAAECEPVVVASRLGIFQQHPGQLSEQRAEYLREVATVAEPLKLGTALRGAADAFLWYTPTRVKKLLNREQILLFDRRTRSWQ